MKARKSAMALLSLVSIVSASNVHAAAIGMPEHFDRMGIAITAIDIVVDDDDAKKSTTHETTIQPLNFVYVRQPTDGIWRYWLEAYYRKTSFDAQKKTIGLTAHQLGVKFTLQRPLDALGANDLYFGAGVQVANNQYKERHEVDSEGYLGVQYDDKSAVQASLLIHFFYEFPLDLKLLSGIKLERSIPVNDDIEETGLSLVWLF